MAASLLYWEVRIWLYFGYLELKYYLGRGLLCYTLVSYENRWGEDEGNYFIDH